MKIDISSEAADNLVREILKQDMERLGDMIAALEGRDELREFEITDLDLNRRFMKALEELRDYYGY